MPQLSTIPAVAGNHCVKRVTGPLCADLKDELAILDPASASYFGLDGVGADVWHAIGDGKTIAEVVAHMVDLYEVDPRECEQDVHELLQELHEEGLITINEAIG